jgi:hypothetical protein
VSEHTELEDRLRTAMHAHATGVESDDRSLEAIRTRVRAVKQRRRAVLAGAGIAAALALAVAVPRMGDESRVGTTRLRRRPLLRLSTPTRCSGPIRPAT